MGSLLPRGWSVIGGSCDRTPRILDLGKPTQSKPAFEALPENPGAVEV